MSRNTTISVSKSTREQLNKRKPDALTYNEFLVALLDEFDEANYRIEFVSRDN